ncbi:DnaJ domain-containing protein [Vibrio sp. Of7-15]|uniref:DNA-J related domain-containing protein n=1 Tax=Vibrio sp. Of7-15 TaxID=2724879 RepID=UPI001EF2E415|nr:DNA-J related domain-containing protein [Vibrio sp. Of7-15]MCG7495385.1 DnaJ domain-containing protein [Vibrio sp. Of7-15]
MYALDSHEEIDNPLIWPILSILEEQPNDWKVHTLAAKLKEQGLMHGLDNNSDLDLFKRNFLMMNALYQLQEILMPKQWLQVEAMDIRLMWHGHATGFDDHEIEVDDPLREYYMDWSHYEANQEEVKLLLNTFWKRYKRHIGSSVTPIKRLKALRILELDETATSKDIRRQWRKLALKWHPDRPDGDPQRFRAACEAWNSLREMDTQL